MAGTAWNALRDEFPECFGEWTREIAIGEGWIPLTRSVCLFLSAKAADERLPPVKVLQVKEKFGGLRFYVEATAEAQSQVIAFAEMLSFTICEACGATRAVTAEGAWLKTLCPECRHRSALIERERPDQA